MSTTEYLITTRVPQPTGVEHMGAVEMSLEPVEQRAATTGTVFEELHAAIAAASRAFTEQYDGDTIFDFSRRQQVIEALGDLTRDGGRVPLPDTGGWVIDVARTTAEPISSPDTPL